MLENKENGQTGQLAVVPLHYLNYVAETRTQIAGTILQQPIFLPCRPHSAQSARQEGFLIKRKTRVIHRFQCKSKLLPSCFLLGFAGLLQLLWDVRNKQSVLSLKRFDVPLCGVLNSSEEK